jgi:hypothetical protein
MTKQKSKRQTSSDNNPRLGHLLTALQSEAIVVTKKKIVSIWKNKESQRFLIKIPRREG